MKFKIKKIAAGRWEVRISDGSGSSRRQARRVFQRRDDAERFVMQGGVEKAISLPRASTHVTFGDALDLWKQDLRGDISAGWRATLESFERDAGPLLAIRIAKLSPIDLRQMMKTLADRGNRSPTIRRKIEWVIRVVEHARECGLVKENPLSDFRLPKATHREREAWTHAEVARFLSHARGKYGGARRWVPLAYGLALAGGLRAGEIWGIRAIDFDFDRSLARVARQLCVRTKAITAPKSRRSRIVPIPRALSAKIAEFADEERREPTDILFQNENGEPIDHRNFAKRFFDVDVKECGVRKICFHSTRHTFGTLAAKAGQSPLSLQAVMGHSSLVVTQRYLHAAGMASENLRGSFEGFFVSDVSKVCREEIGDDSDIEQVPEIYGGPGTT